MQDPSKFVAAAAAAAPVATVAAAPAESKKEEKKEESESEDDDMGFGLFDWTALWLAPHCYIAQKFIDPLIFAAVYKSVLSMLNLCTVVCEINIDIWSFEVNGDHMALWSTNRTVTSL